MENLEAQVEKVREGLRRLIRQDDRSFAWIDRKLGWTDATASQLLRGRIKLQLPAEEKRRMSEIELTKPQEAQCCLSEPVQDNLFHKGASQNGAVSACGAHGAAIGCEPTRWSQPTRSCWSKQRGW